GKVLAMYGGVDYTQQYVNNATRRDYQVGSTFTSSSPRSDEYEQSPQSSGSLLVVTNGMWEDHRFGPGQLSANHRPADP
ncbi:hypothetical protein, partial [Streptomyces vietnamensis]|uniref:hypothetical protein n=1 Tax=Streptomyces vietnamensis TaxID=362257 RepID=UPI003446B41D